MAPSIVAEVLQGSVLFELPWNVTCASYLFFPALCVRACVRACVCVHVCVRACVRACVRVCVQFGRFVRLKVYSTCIPSGVNCP